MTHATPVSKRSSGFSPTLFLTKDELLDLENPRPRGGDGMSEAMDGRGQAHRDVLAAVPSPPLGQGACLKKRSCMGMPIVGLKPDLQERPYPGGNHGA